MAIVVLFVQENGVRLILLLSNWSCKLSVKGTLKALNQAASVVQDGESAGEWETSDRSSALMINSVLLAGYKQKIYGTSIVWVTLPDSELIKRVQHCKQVSLILPPSGNSLISFFSPSPPYFLILLGKNVEYFGGIKMLIVNLSLDLSADWCPCCLPWQQWQGPETDANERNMAAARWTFDRDFHYLDLSGISLL